ncbi:hypothetical protein COCON_G00214660 [Conger conger]|uniref:Uncharacterized protein n=1 Tax=Conger conger TaxID=82655 RepID=A0A9Q1HNG3_CONCO|nr:hypothetical protein COCON_G00214660 [Conger conger]
MLVPEQPVYGEGALRDSVAYILCHVTRDTKAGRDFKNLRLSRPRGTPVVLGAPAPGGIVVPGARVRALWPRAQVPELCLGLGAQRGS